ncbi:radical SAM family heme chaperone HemW [Ferruginibacter sp. SUN106]|uniref:radical SAM family heme chaperone HemW n=1 Tax=Ferruginibacter sp. SUN106 TaxID=2978348 RepID=UPI003D3687BC
MAGIYIHIPFCKQACNYCNFHFSTSFKLKSDFIEALVKEISCPYPLKVKEEMSADTDKEVIATLYFGGGTPSILSIDELKVIFEALQKRFVFADGIEITLEANPDDITDAKLQEWKAIGINRLSVGVQSFLEDELQWMNRAHTAVESLICIDKIKAAGFTNFSVDLIYGSPLLSDADWKKNVQTIIEKDIPHISCYALTVEPKTALDKMIATKKKAPVDAERQAQQFLLLMDWMQEAGYEHYEISNFAKPGLRSKHNSSYWSGEKYYGFGPSAHSYFPLGELSAAQLGEPPLRGDPPKRKWNIANNALYIQSLQKGLIPFEEEVLTETQQLNEYIMTALRTMEGISTKYISTKFGEEESRKVIAASRKYESTGKLKIENEKIILTKEGKLFADGIAADLFS